MTRRRFVVRLREHDAEIVVAEMRERIVVADHALQPLAQLRDVLGGRSLAMRLRDLVIVLGRQYQYREVAGSTCRPVDAAIDRGDQGVPIVQKPEGRSGGKGGGGKG